MSTKLEIQKLKRADTKVEGKTHFGDLATVGIHLLAAEAARHAEVSYLGRFGLPLLEARTMLLLGSVGAASLKAVCKHANIEKAYASRLVEKLIRKGLMLKVADPDDRRAVRLTLTKKGALLNTDLQAEVVQRNDHLMSVLTTKEREVFLRCLARLTVAAKELTALEKL